MGSSLGTAKFWTGGFGRHAQSVILMGLRGVGKTVLLNELRRAAEGGEGIVAVPIEAPEGQSLPSLIVPALRIALLRLDRGQAAMTLAKRGLGALARFVKAFKLSYGELEASLDLGEPGVADNGDLEADLIDLIDVAGAVAASGRRGGPARLHARSFLTRDPVTRLLPNWERQLRFTYKRVP